MDGGDARITSIFGSGYRKYRFSSSVPPVHRGGKELEPSGCYFRLNAHVFLAHRVPEMFSVFARTQHISFLPLVNANTVFLRC